MSATKTGTPWRDSCSVSSCSVLVLPVPVAPAIRPWRFSHGQRQPDLRLLVDPGPLQRGAQRQARLVAAVAILATCR